MSSSRAGGYARQANGCRGAVHSYVVVKGTPTCGCRTLLLHGCSAVAAEGGPASLQAGRWLAQGAAAAPMMQQELIRQV